MTRYAITHTTTYEYAEPVSLCQNVAHLVPRPCPGQRVTDTTLSVTPDPAVIDERTDYFGNPVHYFTVQEPHRRLVVEVTHRVAVEPPGLPGGTPLWESVRDTLPTADVSDWRDAYPFVFDSPFAAADPRPAASAAPSFPPGGRVLAAAAAPPRRIHAGFAYDPRATTIATPVAEVFAAGRGVCQDFAHLLLACLRSVG